MSPSGLELYRRTDQVLHYLWDPIGVAGIPEARDEYHSYLPIIFSLVEKRDASAIRAYLFHVEENEMGLTSNDLTRERITRAVELLLRWERVLRPL